MSPSQAETFIVNSAEDTDDFDLDNGVTTLREALRESDTTGGTQTNAIHFAISGSPRIVVDSTQGSLGAIHPVIIDGTTQQPDGVVDLDGSQAGAFDPGGREIAGFELLGATVTLRGFIIHDFPLDGVVIRQSGGPVVGNNIVAGNRISTNGRHGVRVNESPQNTIGGAAEADRNIITLNKGDGVHIDGTDAGQNIVSGNSIGTDATGTKDLANDGDCVVVLQAKDCVVGRNTENNRGKGNLMSGRKRGVNASLADGLTIADNIFGIENGSSEFEIAMFHDGKLLTVDADVVKRCLGTELKVMAHGDVTVKDCQFMATSDLAAEIDIADDNLKAAIKYSDTVTTNPRRGLVAKESVNLAATIDWTLQNATFSKGVAAGTQEGIAGEFHLAGTKQIIGGSVDGYAKGGLKVTVDLAPNLPVTMSLNGGAYLHSTEADGASVLVTGQGSIFLQIADVLSQLNAGNGIAVDLGVVANTSWQITASHNRLLENVGPAARFRVLGVFKIGGAFLFGDNVVKGNKAGGAFLFDIDPTGLSVSNNDISDNGGPGLLLGGQSILTIAGNNIAGNSVGVMVQDAARTDLTDNIITGNGIGLVVVGATSGATLGQNSIFDNDGLGIDLGNDGPTPNDPGDTDGRQNFPLLTSARSTSSGVIISGALDSKPNKTFSLTFFANSACDPSGFGEGETFLGTAGVKTDSGGHADFAPEMTAAVSTGQVITAIATDENGNSSEFSNCVTVSPGGGGGGGAIAVASNAASTAVQYSDPVTPIAIAAADPTSSGSSLQASVSFQKDGASVQAGLPATLALVQGATSADDVRPGTRNWSVEGVLQSAPGDYAVRFDVADGRGGTGSVVFHILVQPEDAVLQYSGPVRFRATVPTSVQPVDALVSTSFSGFRFNRLTRTFDSVGSLANTSVDTPLLAPLSLILTKISAPGVTLANSSVTTADGLPFIELPVSGGSLQAGQSIQNIILKFNNPGLVPFTFETSVRATVQDFTQATADLTVRADLTDQADGSRGDVRTAVVTFFRDSSSDPANVLGPGALPVQLLDAADSTQGFATSSFTYHLRPDEAKQGSVTVPLIAVASGNYHGESSAQNITISTSPAPATLLSRTQSSVVRLQAALVPAAITPSEPSGPGGMEDPILQLRITGLAGRAYLLQRSDDLTVWTTVTEMHSASGENQFSKSVAGSGAAEFYRVTTVGNTGQGAELK